MSDDLNVSVALSIIDEMINLANEKLDKNSKDKNLKKEILANIELINRVFGIGEREPLNYFQIGIDDKKRKIIEDLIEKRAKAKRERDIFEAIRLEMSYGYGDFIWIHLMGLFGRFKPP